MVVRLELVGLDAAVAGLVLEMSGEVEGRHFEMGGVVKGVGDGEGVEIKGTLHV